MKSEDAEPENAKLEDAKFNRVKLEDSKSDGAKSQSVKFISIEEKRKAQELIRAAADDPKFVGVAPAATHFGEAKNKTCGDEIKLSLTIENRVLVTLGAEVRGCVVTKAAWSLLAERLVGESIQSAMKILEVYTTELSRAHPGPARIREMESDLERRSRGKESLPPLLLLFARPSPRKDCATLPALALLSALR